MGCDWWDVECKIREAANNVNRELSNAGNSVNRELSNAGNSVNSGLDASNWEDTYVQLVSGGLLGVGQDGNIGMGITTRGVRDSLRDVTGANALDEANNRARQLIADQRAEADRLRQEEIARMQRRELSASQAAGKAQQLGFLGGSGGSVSDSGSFNNLTRDFLGLQNEKLHTIAL